MKKLTPEEEHVILEKGTEAPFSGKYANHKEEGTYLCKQCGQELFSSDTKFESGSGWPSFYDVVTKGNVELQEDTSHGMRRVEVVCSACKGHLGHLFDDGPKPTGKRYCINSLSLDFKKKQ